MHCREGTELFIHDDAKYKSFTSFYSVRAGFVSVPVQSSAVRRRPTQANHVRPFVPEFDCIDRTRFHAVENDVRTVDGCFAGGDQPCGEGDAAFHGKFQRPTAAVIGLNSKANDFSEFRAEIRFHFVSTRGNQEEIPTEPVARTSVPFDEGEIVERQIRRYSHTAAAVDFICNATQTGFVAECGTVAHIEVQFEKRHSRLSVVPFVLPPEAWLFRLQNTHRIPPDGHGFVRPVRGWSDTRNDIGMNGEFPPIMKRCPGPSQVGR